MTVLRFFIAAFICMPGGASLWAQAVNYSPRNAHSHNDYEQRAPFTDAYNHGFGSLEADLFLQNDSLYVAHTREEIKKGRTFRALYLTPLLEKLQSGQGRELQLLIDLKTEAAGTLQALVRELEPHASLLQGANVRVVVSGNVPAPSEFGNYPAFILFDGRPEIRYSGEELRKVGLISQSFTRYSRWKGKGSLPDQELAALKKVVDEVHRQGRKIRFWATPDTEEAWRVLMSLGVDYINTDHIAELSAFLSGHYHR